MMVCVDAHQQYWDPTRGDYDWPAAGYRTLNRVFGPAELAPLRARTGVARTIVVQAAQTLDETRYLLGLAGFEPSIAGIVGWVSLSDSHTPNVVAALARDSKFKGVRPTLPGELAHDRWVDEAGRVASIEALIEHDLAFEADVSPRRVPLLESLARRFPRLRIVVDHGATPSIRRGAAGWQPWARAIERLARMPQVHCKLSGLANDSELGWNAETLRPYVDHLLAAFGPERLMWGSDWPRLNLNGDYIRWHSIAKDLLAAVAERERSAVFAENAVAFYRLRKDE